MKWIVVVFFLFSYYSYSFVYDKQCVFKKDCIKNVKNEPGCEQVNNTWFELMLFFMLNLLLLVVVVGKCESITA